MNLASFEPSAGYRLPPQSTSADVTAAGYELLTDAEVLREISASGTAAGLLAIRALRRVKSVEADDALSDFMTALESAVNALENAAYRAECRAQDAD